VTHDERMHQLLYSNEGRVEQCERICKLEELVRDMVDYGEGVGSGMAEFFADRLRELGVKL